MSEYTGYGNEPEESVKFNNKFYLFGYKNGYTKKRYSVSQS